MSEEQKNLKSLSNTKPMNIALSFLKQLTDADFDKIIPREWEQFIKILDKKYQFTKPLARGGEAFVLLCYDLEMSRNCILKIPLWNNTITKVVNNYELGNFALEEEPTNSALRFARGCRIQSNLHTDLIKNTDWLALGYIPAVYNLRLKDPIVCEMEYISGKSLQNWLLDRSKRDIIDILQLFYKMLSFLEFVVHGNSIVHSDLKPDNWIIEQNGRPVLLDFNIAKNLSQKSNLTLNQEPLGSLMYAPKSQLKNAKNRDYKADVYSMALIMHCMLRGHEPDKIGFKGAISQKEIDLEKTFPLDCLPLGLQTIFRKAIIEDENDQEKYWDISQFRKDIEVYIKDFSTKTITKTSFVEMIDIESLYNSNLENCSELSKLFLKSVWSCMDYQKALYLKKK